MDGRRTGESEGPLAGVLVLDLTRLVPGPFCGWLLRSWGARVVKVEDLRGGDYLREVRPVWFGRLNAAAESVGIDLKQPAGRETLLRLAARADIVLEGFRSGVMERLGLAWGQLHTVNPRLVMVSLGGFGEPAERAGHDLTYLARSGLLSLAGEVPAIQWADMAGGLTAAAGALAALHGARTTGLGMHIQTSLLEALFGMGSLLATQAQAGEVVERHTVELAGNLPCYNVYDTAGGGRIALSALEPKFWARFCAAVNHPEWSERHMDPRMHAELVLLFKSRPLADWSDLGDRTDCCLEPVRSMAQAVAERDGLQPVRFNGYRPEPVGPAPRLGETTSDFLRESGFSEQEIEALTAEAVIAAT